METHTRVPGHTKITADEYAVCCDELFDAIMTNENMYSKRILSACILYTQHTHTLVRTHSRSLAAAAAAALTLFVL